MAISPTDPMDELAEGTWHIAWSTLPLWRSRRRPTVTYGTLPDDTLIDIVDYRSKRGSSRRIIGIDQHLPGGGWRWRGTGPVTRFARSDWRFIAGDATRGWAVTAFARTPFTSAGIDMCFRDSNPPQELVDLARDAASADPSTKHWSPLLFRTND